MIEIDKHYIIEARFKKRVTEVEFYEKNDDTILYDTLWRNGEFRIAPATTGECEYIQKFIDLDEDSFEEFDLMRLEAYVYHWNVGSMRVLEKTGFRKEAILKKRVFKDGEYVDEHVFSKLKIL